MHPSVIAFIEKHEEEAKKSGNYRNTLGPAEQQFLQDVWGPAFQFNFAGLKAEYPLRDFRGGDRFPDFVYEYGGIRLLVELDGFTTHARDISPGEFDDHLMRQNDLILAGWMVLRFSFNQIRKRTTVCQRQLIQAIGHWWTLTHAQVANESVEVWDIRKKAVIQLAMRQGGVVKTNEIAKAFGIVTRTAHQWMKRFVSEGLFSGEISGKRTIRYCLKGHEKDAKYPFHQAQEGHNKSTTAKRARVQERSDHRNK